MPNILSKIVYKLAARQSHRVAELMVKKGRHGSIPNEFKWQSLKKWHD